jgi:hypothetical protein
MWRWSKRTDEDFSEEIRANIALDIDRFIAEGMSPEEARAAALRAFGNVTRAQERFYESRRVMWVDDVARDVRYALRTLMKNPVFAVVAIVSLALGVGAATAVFSAVEGVLLNPFPYAGADRMVVMTQAEGPKPFMRTGLTTDQARLLATASSLDAIVLWDGSGCGRRTKACRAQCTRASWRRTRFRYWAYRRFWDARSRATCRHPRPTRAQSRS